MADIRIKDLPTTASDFSSDDFIAIDGTANGTRKINAKTANLTFSDVTLGTSGPSVKSSLAARAARQGLVFDGTAKVPFSLSAFGTNPATIHFWFNPATFTGNPRLIGASSAIQLLLDATGAQFYTAGGSVYSSALTVGKMTAVTVVINGNGTALVYTNGVAGTSGPITANLSTAIDTLGGLASGSVFSGVLSPLIYNRALSATEVVSLYESGVPSGTDYNTASNTNAITTIARNSDFSAGATDWASVSGTATVTASKLDIVVSAGGSRVYLDKAFITGWTAGYNKRWRLTADITNYSVSGGAVVQIVQGTTGTTSGTIAGNGTFSVELTNTNGNVANGQEIQIRNTGTTGTATLTIDNVAIVPLGLILAPDAAQAGGGLAWYDTSGNAANITLPASGVTWNVPTSGYFTAPTTTNLTLAGGSTGASLVLGQGANAGTTLALKGTGRAKTQVGTDYNLRTFLSGTTVQIDGANDAENSYRNVSIQALKLSLLDSSGGNVLIGTTTDIAGSGGLKVAGTTAASSTTSGALQVGANIGLSGNAGGASYFGGNLNISSTGIIGGNAFGLQNTSWFANPAGSPYAWNTWASNTYIANGYAGAFNQETADGRIAFYTAPSGTAGNARTLTERFTIGNTGVVSIPNATPSTGAGSGALQVAGGIYSGAASVFGGAVTAPSATIKRASTSEDAFTNFYTGGSPYWTVGLQAVGTSNDFRIVNAQSGNRSLSISTTTDAATFAGAVTVSGTGTSTISSATTGAGGLMLRNTAAGTGNYGILGIGNDADANAFNIITFSSTYSGTGANTASFSRIENNQASAGLNLVAGGASGTVNVYAGGEGAGSKVATFSSAAATFAGAVTAGGLATVPSLLLTGTASGLTNKAFSIQSSVSGPNVQAVQVNPTIAQTSGTSPGASVSIGGAFTNSTGSTLSGFNALEVAQVAITATNPVTRGSSFYIGGPTSGAVTNYAQYINSGVFYNADTTPSTGAGSGALQVAGGIYAGAASVFGGTLTGSGGFIGTDNSSNNANLFLARSDVSFSIVNETNFRIYSKTGRTNNAASGGINLLEIANTTGNATFAGTVIAPAATTAISSVRLPHGAAPTSPVNGDMWTTTAGLYVRINGVTVGPLS